VTADEKDVPGEGVVPDPIEGHEKFTHLREVYFETNPDYAGRFTVPVLYDKKTKTVVNNESSEILRMFGHAVRLFLSSLDSALPALILTISSSIP
jgi:glutathionyl-hydroquinone reductase